MGTCGNRKGYKVFSISTTIRNPYRNDDFLKVLVDYNGQVFNQKILNEYILKLISKGIYKVSNVSQQIKAKLEQSVDLTLEESKELLANNPQACGTGGRVMTQLRSLKDQNFLKFIQIKRGVNKIFITKFGWDLLENNEISTDIYSKTMIGMHSYNPARTAISNKARPFLNTLFVINEVNKLWKQMGKKDTGIAYHEFGAFVLSMKDCDYKTAANEIIKYRLLNKFKINKEYIENYCYSKLNLMHGKFENIIKEYPDEIYRKFSMTGLLTKRNRDIHTMIDFSNYNMSKINSLLLMYSNYKFNDFDNVDNYFKYLENKIILPWQINVESRIQIAKDKANKLGIKINNFNNLTEIEARLDNQFYFNVLEKTINEISFDIIVDELLILSGSIDKNSKFHDISEPLRLEYLLALALGKKFGVKGLISNIIYNEDGVPLHHAPSKTADIIYNNLDSNYILEPTMTKNYAQQLNTETTSVCEHMIHEQQRNNKIYRTMMIAPLIHSRVTDFFKFKAHTEQVKIIPLSIDAFVKLINESNGIMDFRKKFDEYLNLLLTIRYQDFTDKINSIKIDH